ncbi:hypothetical protein ACIGXM_33795 [Kitasatospora sp. NPDC052896]|uniref:hypothetical protein n=1 Tax=Kitasatospora sp. NPDC052896 TaxID=3364061 RepID=UPI0037CC1B66
MTETDSPACQQLHEIGAELALGILLARERAGAMVHLQRCGACREYVRRLAFACDGLLDLIPGREPPVGFESRVLQRVGLRLEQPAPSVPSAERARFGWLRRSPRSPRSPRSARREQAGRRWSARRPGARLRLAVPAAAAAAALAAGAVGWAIGNSTSGPAPVPAASAPASADGHGMFTAQFRMAGHMVGQVFVFASHSPWMYLSMHTGGPLGHAVKCRLQRADGSTVTVGTFDLSSGDGHWSVAYPAGAAPVTGVLLVGDDGSVLASAPLTAARPSSTSSSLPASYA